MDEESGYLNQPNVWSNPAGIAAGVVGIALGKLGGLTAMIPMVIGIAAFLLLKKYSRMRPQLVPLIAASLAQVGWFAVIVLIQPSLLAAVLPDLVIVGALILWLILKPNRVAAGILAVFQCLSLAYNLFMISKVDFLSGPFVALLVHIALRTAIIGLAAAFIVKFKSDAAEDTAEIFA
jgi:uncharacterized membrane protein